MCWVGRNTGLILASLNFAFLFDDCRLLFSQTCQGCEIKGVQKFGYTVTRPALFAVAS